MKGKRGPRFDVFLTTGYVAMVGMLANDRTERRIAAWYEAQPRRLGVDLAVTCSIQLAVNQEDAAAIFRRWGDRR